MKKLNKSILAIFNFHRFKEPALLLLLVAVAGGIWSFIVLADAIEDNKSTNIDKKIILMMRNPLNTSDPIGPQWLEETVRDLTSLGSTAVLMFITLAAAGFLYMQGKARMALVLLIGVVGGMVLSIFLKTIFGRPRPDIVPHLYEASYSSFPSGHSMMAAATYLTLGSILAQSQSNRLIKIYLISLAVMLTITIGITRIYIGVHWPTDVLAGWVAGAAWALLWWVIAHWLQLLGKVEKTDTLPSEKTARP